MFASHRLEPETLWPSVQHRADRKRDIAEGTQAIVPEVPVFHVIEKILSVLRWLSSYGVKLRLPLVDLSSCTILTMIPLSLRLDVYPEE